MAVKSLSRSGLQASDATNSMLAGYSGSDFELIQTAILGITTASVTFDVSKYINIYKHLQIRLVGRGDAASNYVNTGYRFNGSTSTYAIHELYGAGSSVTSGGGISVTEGSIGYIAGANAGASIFGISIMDIPDFASSNKNKTTKALTGLHSAGPLIDLRTGVWVSTDAITLITIFPTSGNFVAGTRISVYGVRG
jgi:hypothetical protein